MARQKTNLSLDQMTLGMLHLLLDVGEVDSLYEIIDILVLAYGEHYAEANGIDFDKLKEDAMEHFRKTRRPQSTKSKEKQMKDAQKSVTRINIKRKEKVAMVNHKITEEELAGNF